MDPYKRRFTVERRGSDLALIGVRDFDVGRVFDCGQCFRFDVTRDVGGATSASGIALGRLLEIVQDGDLLLIKNCTEDEFERVWAHYLALDVDYESINSALGGGSDTVMREAVACSRGIRILRQDGWEALCSFIISQNNNIPRIKKIIGALCAAYGEPIVTESGTYYTFPSAGRIAALSVDEIFALRTGFRAAYISDAAKKVASGEIDVAGIASMTTGQAAEYLCGIKGVGPKVASCALLFGFDRGDCFPIDVWVKRVLAKYYPDGFDYKALGDMAGIAQQYLFYYERYTQSRNG